MKKCSILIIDDDKLDRYLLKRMLKKLDIVIEIFEAKNGKQALDFLTNYDENSKQHLEDFPPNLIFLDINMPIMGGFEFLENFSKLKEDNEKYTSSIFTMLSSADREEDKKKAEAYDVVKGFITKGKFSPKCLYDIICGDHLLVQ